jgi:hypothetical protein
VVPAGNVVVVITSGVLTENVRVVVAVLAISAESRTLKVTVKLPLAVGVPERAPALDSVSPAGRLPDVIDQA